MTKARRLEVVGEAPPSVSTRGAIDRLMAFVTERRRQPFTGNFEEFERTLHAQFMEAEREILGEELAKADIDTDAVIIEGITCRRVLRSAQTYQTAAGPVPGERTLYKDRTDREAKSMAALDARVGIVDGRWTPLAAEQAIWVVSQMTPQLAEELFARGGNMTPSQ